MCEFVNSQIDQSIGNTPTLDFAAAWSYPVERWKILLGRKNLREKISSYLNDGVAASEIMREFNIANNSDLKKFAGAKRALLDLRIASRVNDIIVGPSLAMDPCGVKEVLAAARELNLKGKTFIFFEGADVDKYPPPAWGKLILCTPTKQEPIP